MCPCSVFRRSQHRQAGAAHIEHGVTEGRAGSATHHDAKHNITADVDARGQHGHLHYRMVCDLTVEGRELHGTRDGGHGQEPHHPGHEQRASRD